MSVDGFTLTSNSLENPVRDSRSEIWREVDLLRKASQVLHRLRGYVIEVDHVSRSMEEGEK